MAATLSEEVVQLLDGSKLISYVVVSSIALFLYDWILMLPVELDVVWSEKLRLLNVLYIIQRYMPFIDTIGIMLLQTVTFAKPIEVNTCRTLYNTGGWMYIIGISLTEIILAMRTWALWGKDNRLAVGLTIFFGGCWISKSYIVHLFLDSQIYIPSPTPQIGCVILGGEPILFWCWAILMVYEAVILILMLIPGLAYFRSGNWSALTTAVYRDGITYYLFLFGLSVTNLLTVLLLPHNLQNLFISYQRVMQTVLTSRVILHMRSQARNVKAH
ncbi:hypothetical protein BDP27DRAFT_945413 [Rhodocollybia butyracea]|uniref:DUF6533 domain-containing protein n=1 Tax=Rhodocollybia butyracea TaxID=206335 RepID=A0A9P5PJP1_9AGAR|nr:hypothetical protein BDP27DRAFT_945413 [Rhodocollybia butyracea]